MIQDRITVRSLFMELSDEDNFMAKEFSLSGKEQIEISNLFCIAIVDEGTILLDSDFETRALLQGNIFAITPLLGVRVSAECRHARLRACCIRPMFFDSLDESQLLYEQLMQYTDILRIPVLPLTEQQRGKICHLFAYAIGMQELNSEFHRGKQHHFCSLLFLEVSGLFVILLPENKPAARRSHAIYRAFRHLLESHHVEEHTLTFYAEQLHVTTTYLSRIVRQLTGHTVLEHISLLLIADAKRMLDCTDLDAKEIATKLYFPDATSFGKFFLKHTGFTPLKYRQRHKFPK